MGVNLIAACSLDTSVIFSLTKKEEAMSAVCKEFLKDIPIEIILCETVEKEYFRVLNYRIVVLQTILREIGQQSFNDFKGLKRVMRDIFLKYKQDKSLDGPTREWIRLFEVSVNVKANKLHELDLTTILTEILKDLQDLKINYVTTYDRIKKRAPIFLTIVPNPKIIKEFGKIISDNDDCTHLSVSFEHAVKNDRWIFFVTVDERHLLAQRSVVERKFFFIMIESPMYVLNRVEDIEKHGSPFSYIKNIRYPPGELKRLDAFTTKTLKISLPLSKRT